MLAGNNFKGVRTNAEIARAVGTLYYDRRANLEQAVLAALDEVVERERNTDEMGLDSERQQFIESMVPHCHCDEHLRPCDGVLAGGMCDDMHERPEDDPEREPEQDTFD